MRQKHFKLYKLYTHLKAVKNPEDINLIPHAIFPRPAELGTLKEQQTRIC